MAPSNDLKRSSCRSNLAMSDVRAGDAGRNNPVTSDQRFAGHWSRKSIHFTAEIVCEVYSIFIPDFCGGLGITSEHRHTKSLRALHYDKIWGFFPFLPHLFELGILKGNCKKQNLRFKSTTTLEGICTILESVKNEQAVLLKADFRKPHSCAVVVHLFVAVALIGHLELASRTESSKTCKTCLWNMKHVSMKHVCYEIYPLKDEEQCHIQQALLCSQPSEKCL